MSIHIKTVLKIDDMDYTLPLPQTQKDFDKYLTEAGILTGDRSEYSIAEIECDNHALNRVLGGAWDIEELNYLAQRLDKMSESDFTNYADIVNSKDGITIPQLIDLAIKIEDIEIEAKVTDTTELGERYITENYPDLDSLVMDNINYDSLGDDIKLEELGEFTDAGYIKEFNKIFLPSNSLYNGKSFPYFDYEDGYSLKIRLCNGAEVDLDDDTDIEEYVDITLPASDNVLTRAMRRLKMDNLHESCISHYYSDKFGQDMMQLFAPDETLNGLHILAMKMDQIPKEKVEEYKEAVAYDLIEGDVDAMIVLTEKFMSGEYQKERAMRDCKEETIRRLTSSACDMAKALGEEAAPDIAALKKQVVNFVNKWDLTEKWIEQFDMDVAEAMPEEQPDESEDQESDIGMQMI